MKKLIASVLIFTITLTMLTGLVGIETKAAQSRSALEYTSVISDNCVMLQFSDGYIEYCNYLREGRGYDIYHNFPLNEDNAMSVGNYSITCADDANYASAQYPVSIDRKTKGDGITKNLEVIEAHSIYLNLPYPLKENKTYTITINSENLNCDKSSITIKTDGLQRTDAIHVNQLGFMPDSNAKYAYVSSWNGSGGAANLGWYAGKIFNIINISKGYQVVYTGTIKKRTSYTDIETLQTMYNQNLSMSDVYECDFSSYKEDTGNDQLIVSIPGIGCSYPFEISSIALSTISHKI